MGKALGNRIKELRGELGIDKAQLAFLTGYSAKAISNWECGSDEPSERAIIALEYALGVKRGELFTYKSMREGNPENERILRDLEQSVFYLREWCNKTTERLESICDTIEAISKKGGNVDDA